MASKTGEVWTAFATIENENDAQSLANAMDGMTPAPVGIGCFEIDEDDDLWEVGGYFAERPNAILLALLEAAYGARPFVVSNVPPEDWVSKVRRELRPVRAGRFVLHGSHDPGTAPPSAIRLRIEAAMAFGTGHHGTTRGCLVAMDRLARKGFAPRRALDLGTGTGALGMGAARLWKCPVIATDIDGVAVTTAKANIRANGVGAQVRAVEASRATGGAVAENAPYDLVFANILAAPLKRLAPQIASVTVSGSAVILSGLLHRQAPGVERVFAGWGMHAADRIRLGEWTTLSLRRTWKGPME